MRHHPVVVSLVQDSVEEELVPQLKELVRLQLLELVLDDLRSLAVSGPFHLREGVPEGFISCFLSFFSAFKPIQGGLSDESGLLIGHITTEISAVSHVI